MQRLADGFANERPGLEKQWESGDNVSTEDLRLAPQCYRSFFDRLLTLLRTNARIQQEDLDMRGRDLMLFRDKEKTDESQYEG
jgi:hypothetical protein